MLSSIKQAARFLENEIPIKPEIAMILGTGLNSIADMIQNPTIIDYKSIPNMSVSTAPSHQGRLIAGNLSGKNIIIMQGRLHYYEGYSMKDITFPIRVLKELGISTVIITNAAGSLREDFMPGDIILLKDHINLMGNNPLIGKNYDDLGERFPSMHEPYNLQIIEYCEKIAEDNNFKIKRGIYAGLPGPSLETRSECAMLKNLGADLVGMSTVPEVIVAVHGGLKVLGISVVTNYSNIFHSNPHSQEEIRENASKARINIEILLKELMSKI